MQDEQEAEHQRQLSGLEEELGRLRHTHLQCTVSLQAFRQENQVRLSSSWCWGCKIDVDVMGHSDFCNLWVDAVA